MVPQVTNTISQLAMKNAASYQKDHDAAEQDRRTLEELQRKLHLRDLPQRIECFDISNISGTLAVGSMVCFQDGRPTKRGIAAIAFRLSTALTTTADAVLRRRYRRPGRTRFA